MNSTPRDADAIADTDAESLPAVPGLPDPLIRSDGTRVATRAAWRSQRAALLRQVLHYEYGELPPTPRNVAADPVRTRRAGALGATVTTLRLRTGPGDTVATRLVLTVPDGDGPFPVIVRGDLCWGRVRRSIAAKIVKRGYVLADFDRTAFAADAPEQDGVYLVYPEFDGGRVAAWAWGFQRVIDWLLTLAIVDPKRIVVTSHSRGGKAALLAGAIDERIALTVPNNSGCGGAGCFRVQGPGSEDIAAITKTFPFWFHPRFRQFASRAERLPFDQHTVKALVAPRALLTTEALGDLWANPEGTRYSHEAARRVYEFLGAADRIGIHFREGGHAHTPADWTALLDFADRQFSRGGQRERP